MGVEKIEITEMPSREMLEQFLAQIVLGQQMKVIFDYEEGRFRDNANFSSQEILK